MKTPRPPGLPWWWPGPMTSESTDPCAGFGYPGFGHLGCYRGEQQRSVEHKDGEYTAPMARVGAIYVAGDAEHLAEQQ